MRLNRAALLNTPMNAERRVSGRFVEMLFSRARGTELATAFHRAGLNLEAVESEYPVEHLPPWLDLLSSSLHPDAPRGEALRRIGFEWMTSFKKPEGHSLEQAMTRLPGSFGRMGNFFDFEVRQITPHGFVATIGDVACLHTFFLGMLEGVTSSTAPTRHEVRWAPAGLSGARYELTAPFRG